MTETTKRQVTFKRAHQLVPGDRLVIGAHMFTVTGKSRAMCASPGRVAILVAEHRGAHYFGDNESVTVAK